MLEFGTGRGYGTVCMAKAMVDHKIDGQIFTVDVLAFNDRQTWPINRGFGPAVEMLSAADVWNRHFETALLDRINRLTGDSGTLAEEWRQRTGQNLILALLIPATGTKKCGMIILRFYKSVRLAL
ncbi:MAG: hypothetical protein CM1200mP25_3930 [Acidobacteriota bacterium]|nr:MAG: hypothetical protein CM1200mP25_3930 [Acidobacteriota bacterium]